MADQQTVERRAAERAARKEKNAKARRAYRQKKKAAKPASTQTAAPQAAKEHGPGRPKVRQGVVVSAKPDKTITVRVDVARRHRMYKKIIRESSTLHVHDERNDAGEGDLVRVVESRPLSKLKRWRLLEVLERSR